MLGARAIEEGRARREVEVRSRLRRARDHLEPRGARGLEGDLVGAQRAALATSDRRVRDHEREPPPGAQHSRRRPEERLELSARPLDRAAQIERGVVAARAELAVCES